MRTQMAIVGILMIMNFQVFSQQPDRQKVWSYYIHVNDAEIFITEGRYNDALQFYDIAFQNKMPNAKDLYNAYIASFLLKDTARTISYFNQLASYGLKKGGFERTKFGKSIPNISSDPFYQYISKDYDSLYAIAQKSTYPTYAKKLNDIYSKDQKARATNEKLNIYYADSLNLIELGKFIKSNGFPSFQRTGFFETLRNSPMNPSIAWLIMWHQRGKYTSLDNVMLDAVKSGDFAPDDYAIIADQKKNLYYTGILKTKDTNLDETEINKKRAEIYLESLEDYRAKLAFQNKDRRFVLVQFMAFAFNFGEKDTRKSK